MRARNTVAFLATVLAVSGIVAAPAGADERGDAVGAVVPPGSSKAPGGNWYLLDAKPGDTINQTIRIVNANRHEVVAIVEPVDAQTNNQTGTQFGRPSSPKNVVGRWIVVSVPQITLGPGETRDVPFTVHIPKNAGAGQYLAGVSASVPVGKSAHDASANRASFAMDIQMQRVVAVEVDVPGPRAPQLAVTGAEPIARPDGIALGVHIANQGNAFAHGNGVIRIADTNTDHSFRIDTFVSHTSIVYPMQWTKRVVPGLHHIQVDLTYEGGRRTSWSGTINIAGDLQHQLEDSLRNVQVRSHHSSVLWLVLAGLAVAALIGGAIRMRRRGRRPGYVKYRTA
jgi:hypothetical protein